MSQFESMFSENKLRIPLSAYAAQIVESDCIYFSKKKTTLINAIIQNFYQQADCSISLRLAELKDDLLGCFEKKTDMQRNEPLINKILENTEKKLIEKYVVTRPQADINWQITLNKKSIELLTTDSTSQEERFYKKKPGRFVQLLIEEYSRLAYHERERIVFKPVVDTINTAIRIQHAIAIVNSNGTHITIKPYKVDTDPLSMYHYVIGYSLSHPTSTSGQSGLHYSNVLSIRISRIEHIDILYHLSGEITLKEDAEIKKELKKGIQFVSSDATSVSVKLTQDGIKRYNSQLHLRPFGRIDESNKSIYHFECTDSQILFYFTGFGKDARILTP